MARIRPMVPADWPAVEGIYAEGIATGNATFAPTPPSEEEFFTTRIPELNLVATNEDGVVIGWVAATPVSGREVYRGVIEHSIYVSTSHAGQGVGRTLLAALAEAAKNEGYWTIQSSIFTENHASLTLHHKNGYRTVGYRERIGHMSYGPHQNTWRNTILIELRL